MARHRLILWFCSPARFDPGLFEKPGRSRLGCRPVRWVIVKVAHGTRKFQGEVAEWSKALDWNSSIR